jgi:hypothetical protein
MAADTKPSKTTDACPYCGAKGSSGIGKDKSPRYQGRCLTPLLSDEKHVKRRNQARNLAKKNVLAGMN